VRLLKNRRAVMYNACACKQKIVVKVPSTAACCSRSRREWVLRMLPYAVMTSDLLFTRWTRSCTVTRPDRRRYAVLINVNHNLPQQASSLTYSRHLAALIVQLWAPTASALLSIYFVPCKLAHALTTHFLLSTFNVQIFDGKLQTRIKL